MFTLLKKETNFQWGQECQEAFQTIKQILTSEPVLRIYDPTKICHVQTDASKIGIGAVLKQTSDENNILHPIAYFSKKLLPYQKNYSISELECLAVVEALDYWHHYLYGKKFVVITDHAALQWLNKVKKPNSRLFKWSLKLSQYDFEIKYKPGIQNVEADSLSRSPINLDFHHEDHLKIVNMVSEDEIKRAQQNERAEGIPMCFQTNDKGIFVKRRGLFTRFYIPVSLRAKLSMNFIISLVILASRTCFK